MAVFSAITAAAHPRVSGENLLPVVDVKVCLGSSPRERGKLVKGKKRPHKKRLIPA